MTDRKSVSIFVHFPPSLNLMDEFKTHKERQELTHILRNMLVLLSCRGLDKKMNTTLMSVH